MRARGEKPDAHAAPDDPRWLWRLPGETGGDFADVPDEIGIERLAARADGFSAVEEISLPICRASSPQRRAISSTCSSPHHCRWLAPKAR